MSGNSILQVALDFEHLSDAEKIARMLQRELHDVKYVCEAGTPLIKNEGLKTVIPRLRSIVGSGVRIEADLKTMDAGAMEVEEAKAAGADMVSVAGVAEEETIDAVFSRAKSLGLEVVVDSMCVSRIENRMETVAKKIKNYVKEGGNALLEYHIPIDIQGKTKDFSMVKEIHDKFGIPISVAGGLDENTIPKVISYGASVCVVGGTITRPKHGTSEEAIRRIKEVIYR